jgi:glycosyltransferase involved in cell wall biosynthesis
MSLLENQMIKVLLIVRWPVGGIRTYLNYVFSSWESPKVQLHILTPNVPEVKILKEQMRSVQCVWHITASRYPSLKEFISGANGVLREYKFDLIHAHGFTSGLAIGWRLPFLKCPSIVTSHDVLNENQFYGFKGILKKRVISFFLNRFSIIHSVSNDAQVNLLKNISFINKEKCCVIPNGIAVEHFANALAVPLKDNLGLSSEVTLIGFFGRFMSQKGFSYLVEALERLEMRFPGKYKVLCFGSGGFIREEQADLEKRNLAHLFFFHDLVPDTAPYIKACDIVVVPSLWEACPLVPMEVLSSGTPLVATRCIGLREVCEDTPAVMVEPANGAALEDGIIEAQSKGKDQFSAFVKVAMSRYSIDNTRKRLQKMYVALVN